MTRIIDHEEALALLERARDRRGKDYVYPRALSVGKVGKGCVYAEEVNGEPQASCIVGEVLINELSVPAIDFLTDYPGMNRASRDRVESLDNESGFGVVSAHLGSYGLSFTHEAIEVLTIAQDAQDAGDSWGGAVTAAQTALENLTDEDDSEDDEFD